MLLGFTLVVLSFLPFSVSAATVCNGYPEVRRLRTGLAPQVVQFPPPALRSELWQHNLCRRAQQLRSRREQS